MEIQKAEPKPLQIGGDPEKLQKAITEKRIFEVDDVKLVEALRYCFLLVGLRSKNFPDKIETAFLIQFIRENYGGHTPAEIRLAWQMAVTGKLGVDPVCYENFSPVYFAGIMSKFRGWAAKTVNELPPPPKRLTPDEIVDINCEYVAAKFKEINKIPYKI